MVDKKIKIYAAAIIVIAVIGIAGIAVKNKKPTQEEVVTNNKAPIQEEIVTIKVAGYSEAASGNGVNVNNMHRIAKDLGYFKGIRIEESELTPGPEALAAVASGQVDAAHVQYLTIVRAVAKGVKVKVVASAHGSRTILFRLYALNDSNIRSAKDLKGKKLGGLIKGTTPDIVFNEYLKDNGLSISDVELVNIPSGQGELVLRSKQVDVVLISSHIEAGIMEEHGGVRLLAILDDTLPKGTHHCGLVVSEKFIKEKPEILKKYLEGFVKGSELERDRPGVAKEYMIKSARLVGADPEMIKYVPLSDIREHAFVADSDIQWFIDRLVERGELKEGQIKPSDVYTNEFNPYYRK